jgi:hypothetical protein
MPHTEGMPQRKASIPSGEGVQPERKKEGLGFKVFTKDSSLEDIKEFYDTAQEEIAKKNSMLRLGNSLAGKIPSEALKRKAAQMKRDVEDELVRLRGIRDSFIKSAIQKGGDPAIFTDKDIAGNSSDHKIQ